jgi:hypothetical protein
MGSAFDPLRTKPAADYSRPDRARAVVTTAPASENDSLVVQLDGFSSDNPYEVAAGHWTPRGSTMPIVGQVCLAIFDQTGDCWVPTFEIPGGA